MELDEEARKLFDELEGIDTTERTSAYRPQSMGSYNVTVEDEARLDRWRLAVIDLVHHIASFFTDSQFLKGVKRKKNPFFEIEKTFDNLSGYPGKGDEVLIRFRGLPTGTGMIAQHDYVVLFGDITVDAAIASNIFSRMGVRASHLTGRLNTAFETFSKNALNSIHLKFPGPSREDRDLFFFCLDVFARFPQAAKSRTPITFHTNGTVAHVPLIFDEHGIADPNLTILAGLNRKPAAEMNDLVKKVARLMNSHQTAESGQFFDSVFNTIFMVKGLKDQLIRPYIEANTIRWMTAGRQYSGSFSKTQRQVAKVAYEQFGNSTRDAMQAVQTVYGNDYRRVDAPNLGTRLTMASQLIDHIERSPQNRDVEREILFNVKSRFDEIREDVLNDISVENEGVKIAIQKDEPIFIKLHRKVLGLLFSAKSRSAVRNKIRGGIRKSINFSQRDYRTIAADFGISPADAEKLIQLLKSCFDDQGYFLRSVFERNIPNFLPYEKRVFGFMWHFLKETPHRNDRVAFLNALQILIDRLQQPAFAVKVLMDDFLSDPTCVQYSDRNAFMLANLLIRKYNKELSLDIEITPEEVLLVKDGINAVIAKKTSVYIDRQQDAFYEKVRTIRLAMMESLNYSGTSRSHMSLRYLFSLEREISIFLSLIGGRTAYAILKDTVRRNSDPGSEIYNCENSRANLSMIFQNLRVAIRAFQRVAKNKDRDLFDDVSVNRTMLLNLCSQPDQREKVGQLVRFADLASQAMNRKEIA